MKLSTHGISAVLAAHILACASPLLAREPERPKKTSPAPVKPAPIKPVPAQPAAPPIPFGKAFHSDDLKLITIGSKGGIIKIKNRRGEYIFVKEAPGAYPGVDSDDLGPVTDNHRQAITEALNIQGELADVASTIIDSFKDLDLSKQKKEAIAVLGIIASFPESSVDCVREKIENFLCEAIADTDEKNVFVHRQALLALAVAAQIRPTTINALIKFLETHNNNFETYTAKHFFKYKRGFVLGQPNAAQLIQRIQGSGNCHTDELLDILILKP